MGNIIQLLFSCKDYFRYRNIELITDSHFGHIVPVAYLRLWNAFATCSFTASSRIGISNIKELSTQKLGDEDHKALLKSIGQTMLQRLNEVEGSDSDTELDIPAEDSRENELSKPFRRLKTRLKIFEKQLSIKNKGSFDVWKTKFQLLENRCVDIYLHAVNDSKVVYRISNKYAAQPRINLNLKVLDKKSGKKVQSDVETSPAQWVFRKKMGFNDQSDQKRAKIGLSGKYYKQWPKHLIAKTIEDAIINGFNNYLLDPNCPIESFPVYLHYLVEELLESGENLRVRDNKVGSDNVEFKRSHRKRKRFRPGTEASLLVGGRCLGGKSIGSIRLLPPSSRSKRCAFCGREKAQYKCRSCVSHLCMKTPQKDDSGKQYPQNGPCCYLRYHGISNFPRE